MLKVGVIGYGYSAKTFHIPLINASELFQLAAISSSQKDTIAVEYPDVAVFKTAQDLIASTTVDLVVITAPNAAHYPIAKQFLKQHKT